MKLINISIHPRLLKKIVYPNKNLLLEVSFRTTLFLYLSFYISLFAQVPNTINASHSTEDFEQYKQVVESYYQSWKNAEYGTMYSQLSKKGMGQMPKEEFIYFYGLDSDNKGKLSAYTLNDAKYNDNVVIVKVEMTFEKERKPVLINGIHNFHMVKEKGKWIIKTIVAPITPPAPESGPGGSHPGE